MTPRPRPDSPRGARGERDGAPERGAADAPRRRRAAGTGRLGIALAALAAAALLLVSSGCDRAPHDVGARRAAILEAAARDVSARLEDALRRARAALAGLPAALDRANGDRTKGFAEIERLRARTEVDGLTWEDADGTTIWAGAPVEPKELPDAPAPWAGSFARGDVVFHAGPFVRALVVSGAEGHGGAGHATVVLEEPGASVGPFEGTVERRWAARLGVHEVRILPPEVLERPAEAGLRRAGVGGGPSRAPVLAVEVEAPADDVLAAQVLAGERRSRGLLGLAGLALAGLAAWAGVARWVKGRAGRGAAVAVIALLLREGLQVLDLPARFEGLAPAFRSGDFGLSGFHGWLSSPGDLLLTCLALLGAAFGLARLAAAARPAAGPLGRGVAAAAGLLLLAAATRGWLFLVEATTAHSTVDMFAPGTLAPSLPRALLLGGLAAATAAGWMLSRAGLRLAIAAARGAAPTAAAVLSAGLGAALGWWAGETGLPLWAAALLPGAAVLVGRLAPGGARPGAPSRVLLVSVLSTALLFPVLWRSDADVSRAVLQSQVSDLVLRPASLASTIRLWLEPLVEDNVLVRALTRQAQYGVAPEGLALYTWRRVGFDTGRMEEGVVYVYDAKEFRFDRFGINAPPFRRMPDPRPDPVNDDDPITVVDVPWAMDRVAATVGRVRIRSPEGKVVGTIGVVVPDALTVELQGLSPRIALKPPEEGEADRRAPRQSLSLVKNGRVLLSTDPQMPHAVPPRLALDGLREPTWLPAPDGEGEPWLAVPAGDRGVVLARPLPRRFEDLLFGLARVSSVVVGAGALLAGIALLAGLRRYRPRLQDKILWSYFAVSVVTLVLAGVANWRDVLRRAEEEFRDRQTAAALSARAELERTIGAPVDLPESGFSFYAESRGLDLSLYRNGDLQESTLKGLVQAELLPTRLAASVYRATELEGRDLYVREEAFGGRTVRVAYTPMRDPMGRPTATLSLPLIFDSDRAEQRASETGSVLLATYLLTLLLVVVIGIYVSRGLTRRIGHLAEATKRVAAGELDLSLPGAGRDEIGSLVQAFNGMTAELKAARERAARAERETAWRGMARQVAHEIKNPLTPMKLMLQQLQATARSDRAFAAEMVEPTAKVVLEQIDALSRIASDFAAFARFPPRHVSDVDVNEVLRSVATLYGSGEGGQAEVVTFLDPDVPRVRWDQDELRRVYLNLVANAVQAVDEAKGRVHVEVRSSRAPVPGGGRPGVLVTVTDDGVGISAEDRPRLFEPDFSTKTHGTGLGLAIVKRILADLGGDIRIDSAPGRGTTVSTWLPASEGAAPPAEETAPPPTGVPSA